MLAFEGPIVAKGRVMTLFDGVRTKHWIMVKICLFCRVLEVALSNVWGGLAAEVQVPVSKGKTSLCQAFAPFAVSFEVRSAFVFCFKHESCRFFVDVIVFLLEVLCPLPLARR